MLARAIVLLLLCMNLGVAAWWATRPPDRAPPLPAIEPGVPRLVLLAEVARPARVESAELSAAPAPLATGSICLSLGPFATPADLRIAMNRLLPSVDRIQYRETATTEVRGYRVFLPAAASRAQALETARALSTSGISDYYVVTAGEQQNTISLGQFRDLDNARRRHDDVAALGYDPTLEPRTEQVPQWWIDFAAAADFAWQAVLEDTGLQAQPLACG